MIILNRWLCVCWKSDRMHYYVMRMWLCMRCATAVCRQIVIIAQIHAILNCCVFVCLPAACSPVRTDKRSLSVWARSPPPASSSSLSSLQSMAHIYAMLYIAQCSARPIGPANSVELLARGPDAHSEPSSSPLLPPIVVCVLLWARTVHRTQYNTFFPSNALYNICASNQPNSSVYERQAYEHFGLDEKKKTSKIFADRSIYTHARVCVCVFVCLRAALHSIGLSVISVGVRRLALVHGYFDLFQNDAICLNALGYYNLLDDFFLFLLCNFVWNWMKNEVMPSNYSVSGDDRHETSGSSN